MSGKDDHASLRSLAAAPVHARALRLNCAEWTAVLTLPFACETMGEPCPGWAGELCQHATAVCLASPAALLHVLVVADFEQPEAPCEPGIASLGAALALSITSPRVGPRAWISITPFGHAVAMVYLMRRELSAAVAERGGSHDLRA